MQSYSHEHIAQLAYKLWQERGCPEGTPEVDWDRAMQLLDQPSQSNMATLVSSGDQLESRPLTPKAVKPRGKVRSLRGSA
jgi:hypothetical protein